MRTLARLITRPRRSDSIAFCDSCGQVCTAACRANARLDAARTAALHAAGPR